MNRVLLWTSYFALILCPNALAQRDTDISEDFRVELENHKAAIRASSGSFYKK